MKKVNDKATTKNNDPVKEEKNSSEDIQPRKVLIATPSFDGRVDVWCATAIVDAVRIAQSQGIFLHPIFLSYDALIQRARNDLIGIAVEGEYDDMIFVDSDIEFHSTWIMNLLDSPEDVIGGTYRKKTDAAEIYAIKTKNLKVQNGLIKVESLGAGFLKLSSKAFKALWNSSQLYHNEGKIRRMVFNIDIVNDELVSEDVVMCSKLRKLGFDIWLNPEMTCCHIGTKKYFGNIANYIQRLQTQPVNREQRRLAAKAAKKKSK